MSDRQRTINVNPDAVTNRLLHSLHLISRRVSLGLTATAAFGDGPVSLPDVFMQSIWGKEAVSSEETRDDFATWLVGVGLREGIGALELFLVEIRFIAGLLESSRQGTLVTPVSGTGSDILRALHEQETKKFAKNLNWAKKLESLQSDFGMQIDWGSEILSINTARNCLTHRGGIVGTPDINDKRQEVLVVKYRALELIDQSPEGNERIVGHMGLVPAGHALVLKSGVPRELVFKRDQRIRIAAEEFNDIMRTIYLFGQSVTKELSRLAREAEVVPPKPGGQKTDE